MDAEQKEMGLSHEASGPRQLATNTARPVRVRSASPVEDRLHVPLPNQSRSGIVMHRRRLLRRSHLDDQEDGSVHGGAGAPRRGAGSHPEVRCPYRDEARHGFHWSWQSAERPTEFLHIMEFLDADAELTHRSSDAVMTFTEALYSLYAEPPSFNHWHPAS